MKYAKAFFLITFILTACTPQASQVVSAPTATSTATLIIPTATRLPATSSPTSEIKQSYIDSCANREVLREMFITNYTDPYGRTAQEALAIARADEHFVNGYIKDGIK